VTRGPVYWPVFCLLQLEDPSQFYSNAHVVRRDSWARALWPQGAFAAPGPVALSDAKDDAHNSALGHVQPHEALWAFRQAGQQGLADRLGLSLVVNQGALPRVQSRIEHVQTNE